MFFALLLRTSEQESTVLTART